ncbi:MAG: hypothetical protein HYS05_04120 [Acidobacteria bacterium]|nr:hypothetical protein [Acidobacteriota bacterium]
MKDAAIGRVFVASLHQAIADLLPTRLEFYENWLNPFQLRKGRLGLAPLVAVIGFLRKEGDSYALITARAGEYAADWTFDALPAYRQQLCKSCPLGLRQRLAAALARRLIRRTYSGTRAIVHLRRGSGEIDLRGSLFCTVREPGSQRLCHFYAAAVTRLLQRLDLDGEAQVARCRAVGDAGCVLSVALKGPRLKEAAVVCVPS